MIDWSHTALTIGVILGGALTLAGILIWVERRLLGSLARTIRPQPSWARRLPAITGGYDQDLYERRLDSALRR